MTEDYYDKFAGYEKQFNPEFTDRQARRKRRAKVNHKQKKSEQEILAAVGAAPGVEGSFSTTYQPARYERGWLLESLTPFYVEEYITDVVAQVKGGKEASVYRCLAHPGTGHKFLAVKVYRPRKFRNLRNDGMYREGRQILTAEGRGMKPTDERVGRALFKKTSFGAQVQHTSWLMHEFVTLERLFQAEGAVPQPIAASDNAILMSYCGDEYEAAPTLHEIDLRPDEVEPLFQEVLRNIELMLELGFIHGDLSAFNILYWEGEVTLIDFPQVTDVQANKNALFILERDITRICDYFNKQGLEQDAQSLINTLWKRYAAVDEKIKAADESRIGM